MLKKVVQQGRRRVETGGVPFGGTLRISMSRERRWADFFSILLESDTDFIQVSKQVSRVLVDPIGSRPL
jgi:hypothetical protein